MNGWGRTKKKEEEVIQIFSEFGFYGRIGSASEKRIVQLDHGYWHNYAFWCSTQIAQILGNGSSHKTSNQLQFISSETYSGCVEDACDMIILLPEQVTKRTVAEIEIHCSEASELCSRTDTDFLHYAKNM